MPRLRWFGLVLGIVFFCLLHWGWGGPEGRPLVGTMAGIAALMATWWVTEAMPIAATALLPLVLFPLLGIAEIRGTMPYYFTEITTLSIGAFLYALAIEQWNLHRRIALHLLHLVGTTPTAIIGGFLVSAGVLSMWLSNSATAMMMLPIGLAVASKLDETFGEAGKPVARGLLLAIAYGCSLGGVATFVGTPTNLVFLKIYKDTFPQAPEISFSQWIAVAAPIAALHAVVIWLLLSKVFCRTKSSLRLDPAVIEHELRALGPMTREQKLVAIFFGFTALLWVFRGDLNFGAFIIPGWNRLHPTLKGVDDGMVAIAMSLWLFILPASGGAGRRILDASIFNKLPWDLTVMCGGGLALAGGFVSSGLTLEIAAALREVGQLPTFLLIILIVVCLSSVTEVTSNSVTATVFLPILAAWSVAVNVHPLLIMVPATIATSMAFMLPIGTPPNLIVFASRRIPMVEMIKVGAVFHLFSYLIIAVVCYWLLPIVMQFDPAQVPLWAGAK